MSPEVNGCIDSTWEDPQGRLKVGPGDTWRRCQQWARSAGLRATNARNLLHLSRSARSDDLISCLKAIPDGRYRRGVR